MTNEIAKREEQSVSMSRADFTPDQINLIRSQVAPAGTTNDELALFLAYAQRTGLDPFARQIYLSERRAKDFRGEWVTTRKPEVTIDGFRLVAERTGKYAGQVGPEWCGEDGIWRDVWVSAKPPVAARVGILRSDFREPLYAVALYREYVQTTKDGVPNQMWTKMPANQTAKCAEALALRRAFPRELSGLYTDDEMAQADNPSPREAQQEIAQRKIAELHKAPALAPPPPDPEAPETPAPEPPAKGKGKKLSTAFDMLSVFQEMKQTLKIDSGSDDIYYGVLKQHGYEKSNEIPNREAGAAVWKSMEAALKSLRLNKANREEAVAIRAMIGDEKFWQFAGSEGVDLEAWESMTGEALQAFLAKLREYSHAL